MGPGAPDPKDYYERFLSDVSMAFLINDDLLMPSSVEAVAIRLASSAERRNAISGYFEAGLLVLVLVFVISFLLSLVGYYIYSVAHCLTTHNLLRANSLRVCG